MITSALLLYFGLPILLQSILLWLLLRRNALHDNPWFVNYTAFSIAATIIRLVVFKNATVYFYFYWAGQAIYAILSLLVLYEVFESMFLHYIRIWWFKSLFPVTALVAVSVAILRSTSPQSTLDAKITHFVLAFEFVSDWCRVFFCCLVVPGVAYRDSLAAVSARNFDGVRGTRDLLPTS